LFIDLPEAIANTAIIAQRCAVGAPKRIADPAAPVRP
jgi:DNA polymerase III alpha subunit